MGSLAIVLCLLIAIVSVAVAQQAKQEPSAAEHTWNERLRQAREKVKDLERRADQTELEINRLRNILFSAEPRSPETHNRLNTQIAELTRLMRRLRAEALVAEDEADAILAEGAAKKFKVESLSPTTKTFEPNLEYYRLRFAELQSELRDAEARAQVMQLRINDLNRRITINAVTGDNFFIGRLRDELPEAQRGLELARARIAAATRQIEELREQARAARVPPGVLK
jgi:chromosome segregation ATPase